MNIDKHGIDLLRDPSLNKSTAFSDRKSRRSASPVWSRMLPKKWTCN